MKKYLVNIYDRGTLKRLNKLIVKAESPEEANKIAMDWHNRKSGLINEKEKV